MCHVSLGSELARAECNQCLSKTLDLEAVLHVPLSYHGHFWKVVYGLSHQK